MTPAQLAEFKHAKADAIVAPVAGQIFWEFQGEGECAPAVEPFIGKEYKEGDAFCYILAPWGEFETVPAALGGKLVEINAKQGSKIRKGDVIAYIEREIEQVKNRQLSIWMQMKMVILENTFIQETELFIYMELALKPLKVLLFV